MLKAWTGRLPRHGEADSEISPRAARALPLPGGPVQGAARDCWREYHVVVAARLLLRRVVLGRAERPDDRQRHHARRSSGEQQQRDRQPPFYVLAGDPNEPDKVELPAHQLRWCGRTGSSWRRTSRSAPTRTTTARSACCSCTHGRQGSAADPDAVPHVGRRQPRAEPARRSRRRTSSTATCSPCRSAAALLYVEPVYIERASQQRLVPAAVQGAGELRRQGRLRVDPERGAGAGAQPASAARCRTAGRQRRQRPDVDTAVDGHAAGRRRSMSPELQTGGQGHPDARWPSIKNGAAER